jgi:hypothetical protein
LYFSSTKRDKKVVSVFVRFRTPLQQNQNIILCRPCDVTNAKLDPSILDFAAKTIGQ